MLEFLETGWEQPDEGIWEVRGPRRHFVHSKMMAWVAVDRLMKMAELGRFAIDIPAGKNFGMPFMSRFAGRVSMRI
jgi:hypothetical protein